MVGRRRPDPGFLGQIRDIGEALPTVRIAILAQVIAQPQARKFARSPVGPFDAEPVGKGPEALHRDDVIQGREGVVQGRCFPLAAAFAFKKYRQPAPNAARTLTPARATNTPCQPKDTEIRATLSPATTAPRYPTPSMMPDEAAPACLPPKSSAKAPPR